MLDQTSLAAQDIETTSGKHTRLSKNSCWIPLLNRHTADLLSSYNSWVRVLRTLRTTVGTFCWGDWFPHDSAVPEDVLSFAPKPPIQAVPTTTPGICNLDNCSVRRGLHFCWFL